MEGCRMGICDFIDDIESIIFRFFSTLPLLHNPQVFGQRLLTESDQPGILTSSQP